MFVFAILVGVGASTTAPELSALLSGASRARELGDWESAERLLAQAYQIKAAPEILYNRARAAEAMDRLPLASRWYQEIAADLTIAPAIRARATEHANRLSKLHGSGLLRLERGSWLLDGLAVSGGLIPISAPEVGVATTSPTQTWWSKVRLPPGEVTRISESMMRAEASACLEVGEHWVRQIDGLRFDLSTERLCLSPGSHHILLADGSSFEVELAQGTIELSSTLRSPAPVAPWVFWLTSGGALTGGAVAIGVGASARSSVIEAKQDPEGRIISQSQREAFEAQARGDTAMTLGVILVSTAAVLAVGGVIAWLLEK
jgi:hypothetical protein